MRFCAAYNRGVKAAGMDYQWYWSVDIGLCATKSVAHQPGDFVECGVNAGFMNSSIMHARNWDALGKTFFRSTTLRESLKIRLAKKSYKKALSIKVLSYLPISFMSTHQIW